MLHGYTFSLQCIGRHVRTSRVRRLCVPVSVDGITWSCAKFAINGGEPWNFQGDFTSKRVSRRRPRLLTCLSSRQIVCNITDDRPNRSMLARKHVEKSLKGFLHVCWSVYGHRSTNCCWQTAMWSWRSEAVVVNRHLVSWTILRILKVRCRWWSDQVS